jgi:hypothetical protein
MFPVTRRITILVSLLLASLVGTGCASTTVSVSSSVQMVIRSGTVVANRNDLTQRFLEATVSCLSGEQRVSGGYQAVPIQIPYPVQVDHDVPQPTSNFPDGPLGWSVIADPATTQSLTAYALCAQTSLSLGLQVYSRVESYPDNYNVLVACPSGSVIVGGGYAAASDQVGIYPFGVQFRYSRPQQGTLPGTTYYQGPPPTSTFWEVVPAPSPYPLRATIRAYAVCATQHTSDVTLVQQEFWSAYDNAPYINESYVRCPADKVLVSGGFAVYGSLRERFPPAFPSNYPRVTDRGLEWVVSALQTGESSDYVFGACVTIA